MLDKTTCKHRVSRKKSLGLSLLPATLAACPDSSPSAQAILVTPLPPKTASSIYVHCRVGKGQVTACPQRSCTLRSIPSGLLTLAQAFLATIQKSRQVTNWLWTELCSAVNGLFVARFGFVSSPNREKTVWFTWAQWKEENVESQSF